MEREDCFFDTVGLVVRVSLEGEGAAESDTILFEARPPSEKEMVHVHCHRIALNFKGLNFRE